MKPPAPFAVALSNTLLDQVPDACRELVAAIIAGASHSHPAFQQLVAAPLATLMEQVRPWLHGQLNYLNTEAWRAAYELVLSEPEVREYRSVAWVKTEDYWQDLPGQHAMQFNYGLLDRGVKIERTFILGWNLWPPELALPKQAIRAWIDEQHYRGVEVWLVREPELIGEPDLLCDFGIYGDEATGRQELDEASRTICYTLSFDPAAIRLAKDRWMRLALFAQSYADLLDRGL